MTEKTRVRLGAYFVFALFVLLAVSPATQAIAGVSIDVGATRGDAVQAIAKEHGVSTKAANQFLSEIERRDKLQVIEQFHVRDNAQLDFYKVKQKDMMGQPSASYEGSGYLVSKTSKIGQAYSRKLKEDKSWLQRLVMWFDGLVHPQEWVVIPLGYSGLSGSSLFNAAKDAVGVGTRQITPETVKIAVLIAEFPAWHDLSPENVAPLDARGSETSGDDIYYPGGSGSWLGTYTARAEYAMMGNASNAMDPATDQPSQWAPGAYADSAGGALSAGYPLGTATQWDELHQGRGPTWDPNPDYPTPENRNTDIKVRNYWNYFFFDLGNPNSVREFFYQNTHNHISISGPGSAAQGWLRSHHVLDRYPFGGAQDYTIQPGTPLIRPLPVDEPFGILRASMSQNGLTILFTQDASSVSLTSLQVHQADAGSATGNQAATVTLSPASGTSWDWNIDTYDARRWTLVNVGTATYPDVSGGATPRVYDDEDDGTWEVTVSATQQLTGATTSFTTGDAYPTQARTQRRGSPNLDVTFGTGSTLFSTADVFSNDDTIWRTFPGIDSPLGGVVEYPPFSRLDRETGEPTVADTKAVRLMSDDVGNRLKHFNFYCHTHAFYQTRSGYPYQLRHLRAANTNYTDDIGGTTESTSDRVDRPYPFNYCLEDNSRPNYGFWRSPGDTNHTAANMRADIDKVCLDQGINLDDYTNKVYVYPYRLPYPRQDEEIDSEDVPGLPITPHADLNGDWAVIPDNASAGLARHEVGHNFGLRDLYDNDLYNNWVQPRPNPEFFECDTLGPYSLMAGGGRIDAWHLIDSLGVTLQNGPWAHVVPVTDDRISIEIPQSELALQDPVILKLPANPYYLRDGVSPDDWVEYFLIENRYTTGSSYFGDASEPGMYIYHVDRRDFHYLPRGSTNFQVEERALSVAMVQADGLNELENNRRGTHGTTETDPFGKTNKSFTQLTTPSSWSNGDSSETIDTKVIKPQTPTDSFVRVVSISDPGPTMRADIYVKPREVVVALDGAILTPPAFAQQGEKDVPIIGFTLENSNAGQNLSTGDVVINQIKIREAGTNSTDTTVERASLFVETTNPADGLDVTKDTRIGTAAVVDDYVIFQNLGYRVRFNQPKTTMYLTYDISPTAQTNPKITVAADMADYKQIIPEVPGAVQERERLGDYDFGAYHFPITSTSSVPIYERPDVLTVTGRDIAPDTAVQGQPDIGVLALNFAVNVGDSPPADSVNIKDITLNEIGDCAATTDLKLARLHEDTDGDGVLDPAEAAVWVKEASFTVDGGVEKVTFQNVNLTVQGGAPKDYIVSVSLNTGAMLDTHVQLTMVDNTYIVLTQNPSMPPAYQDSVSSANFPFITGPDRTAPDPDGVLIAAPNEAPVRVTSGFAVDGIPSVPTLTTANVNPVLSWDEASDPDPADTPDTLSYRVQLATDAAFSSIIREINVTAAGETSWTIPDPPLVTGLYYWRIYTRDSHGVYSLQPSDTQQFRVQQNQPPTVIAGGFSVDGINLTAISPGAAVTRREPLIAWNKATDPDTDDTQATLRYELQVDDNSDFTSPVTLSTSPGSWISPADQNYYQVVTGDDLQWGVVYYWRVRAMDDSNLTGPWSTIALWFKPVNDQAPVVPTPSQLIGGEESLSANPVLKWRMPGDGLLPAIPGSPDPDVTDTIGTIYYEVQLKKGDGDFSAGTIIEYVTAAGSQQWAVTEDKDGNDVDLDDNSQYFWRVRALDDEDVPSPWTAVQDFWVNTVNDPPVAPDSGFEPVSGATTNTTTPTLSWDNSADPDVDPYDGAFTTGAGATRVVGVTWLVQLSRAADFSPVVYNYSVPARTAAGRASITVTTPLTDDTTWYWRVGTIDDDGAQSPWSTIRSFVVDTTKQPPVAPTGLIPTTGQSVSTTQPRLSWVAATDPDLDDTPDTLRYEVEVSEDANSAQAPGYFWSTTTTLADRTYVDIPASDELTEGMTYYWRVRTFDNDGMRSPWTTPGARFNVVANRPPNRIMTGFVPVSGGTVSDRTPVLRWTAATPPDPDADDTADTMRYTLQVDNNSNFLSPEFNATEAFSGDPLQPEMEVTTTLAVGVTYHWRVMARDQKGLDALEWSPTQNFRVVANQPPATPREPYSPTGGAVETTARPTLEWRMPVTPDPNPEDPIDTITYDIEVCDAADFSAGNIAYSATGLTLTPTIGPGGVFLFGSDVTTDLDDNGHYWWRVRAVDDEGAQSPWTAGQEFWVNTGNDDPEPPTSGFDPPDGSSIINPQPRLSWDPGTDPDPLATAATLRYRVELSSDDFATAPVYVYDIGVAGRTYIDLPSALTDDTDWAWRVYTIDAAGAMSAASAVQHMYLDTDNSPPSVPASGFNPTGGRNVSDITPTLSWDASTDPDATDLPETLRYVVQLCSNPAFPSPAPVDTYFWTATSAPGVISVTVPDPNALTNGTTYYWRVLAMDDSSTRSAWSSNQVLIVGDNQPPNAPTGGFVPPNNAAVSDTTPMLGWNPATDPDANHTAEFLRYEVWVDDNANFLSRAFEGTTPQGQAFIEVTPALLVGTQYFWQVRTQDPYGEYSAWSPTRAFTIVENSRPFPPEPTFVPSGAREVNSATPTLRWSMPDPPDPNVNDGLDTMRYEVQLNNKVDLANGPYVFTTLTPFDTLMAMETDCTALLLDDTQYWWRVRARDGQGALSDWSTVQTFWVNLENDAPLAPPSGFDPTNGEQVSDATPLMSWNYATDPDPYDTADTLHYVVELSTAENFSDVSYQYTTADGERQVTPTAPLTDVTDWYWRVLTVDRDGAQSPWSATQHFYVDLGNQLPALTNPQCTPLYGILNLTYQLQVTYTDPENDPAEWVRCTFTNGLVVDMVKADPYDNNARDGMLYTIGVTGNTLGLGAHAHAFSCKAGTRLPALDTDFLPGPIIGVASTTRFVNAGCGTKTVYEEGDLVWVYVTDADENSDPAARDTVEVTVTEQNGDSEIVTLTEMANNSGTFLGSIPTTGGAGAVNDGALNSNAGASGNSIVATYRDPDDGSAPAPDQSVDNAQVIDTKAPDAIGVALTAATGPHGRTVNLDWSTYDEALQGDVAGYHVYYRDAAFSVSTGITLAMTVPAGTKTCTVAGIVPPGLSPNKDYWFGVAAFDEVPHERVSISSVQCTTRDTSTPTINSQIPSPGATDVALDTPISFILEDPGVGVDQSTLVVTVRQNGTVVPHGVPTFTGDKHSLQVSVTPTEPLRWNAAVSVEVVVRDFDGNQLTTSWTFSTVTDVELPTLDEQLPTPDATSVPVTTNIGCSLHDTGSGIDTSSVVMLLNGQDVSAGLTFTPAGGSDVRVLYDPPTLSYNMHYVVSATAADKAGNTIGPITWAFDTVVDAGTVGADQFTPARDATNVPINTNVALRLSDAQSGIDASTLRMWVHGSEVTASPNLTTGRVPDGSANPSSIGIVYDPPADFPYDTDIQVRVLVTDMVGNQTDLNYKFRTAPEPTYNISGLITKPDGTALAGVTVTAGGETVETDGYGAYRITGLVAGTYTVTPTRAEYDFTPSSAQVTIGPDDATADFLGTQRTYQLRGRVTENGVGLAAVSVGGGGQTAQTDANGNYVITGLPNGQYTVTPTLANYHFQPSTRAAQVASAHVADIDFEAIADTFTVSGTITSNAGAKVEGAQVSCGDRSAITNAAGQYVISGLRAGSYTVTPVKAGYLMEPLSRDITLGPSDAGNVDFTAHIEMISDFPAGLNLIGVPGTPTDRNPMEVFDIDPLRNEAVYRFNPALIPPRYIVGQNDPTAEVVQVRAGRGFFCRFAEPTQLRVAGIPTADTATVSIGLSEGWNMIANPRSMPVRFGSFASSVPDAVRPFAFVYDNATGSYLMVSSEASLGATRDSLIGWEGAWVRATSGGVSLMLTPGVASVDKVARPQQASLNGGWTIPVLARAGNRSDLTAMAGVVPGAGSAHTIENPPTPPETVDVYFTDSAGTRLAHDIRSDLTSQTFDFVVSCEVPDALVTVSLPDLSNVPSDLQVVLVDKQTGKSMYARTMQAYSYRSEGASSQRSFELVVSPRTIGALHLNATAAQANGNNVALTYTVTKACNVNVRVMNLAGRCIRTLIADKPVQAGVQSELWNLCSSTGTRVPAGIYLLQIEAVTDNGQRVQGMTQVRVTR